MVSGMSGFSGSSDPAETKTYVQHKGWVNLSAVDTNPNGIPILPSIPVKKVLIFLLLNQKTVSGRGLVFLLSYPSIMHTFFCPTDKNHYCFLPLHDESRANDTPKPRNVPGNYQGILEL